jgi:hypothetical protein
MQSSVKHLNVLPLAWLLALGLLVLSCNTPTLAIDDAKAVAEGIRKIPGKRLTLYTDLTGAEIDQLPTLFDQAFPQWCAYFGVKPNDRPDWHMTGCLMKDKARFAAAGLLPDDLPPFDHGYSKGDLLWINEQPSDYYRRHLLLHEGVHGFMNTVLGHCGPLWYMEGIAEYLATHRWTDGRLTLGYMPRSREEAPMWGRVRLIQDAVAERRALPLNSVLDFIPTAHRENELYAWCWAAATLLDRHPRYQERFRQLKEFVRRPDSFNDQFRRRFESDWQELCEEWQLMGANLEYGYDVPRSAVDFSPATISPLPTNLRSAPREGPGVRAADESSVRKDSSITIAADRGWQNSGLRLEAGVKYRLTATGRYQLAKSPKTWWSEPNGVSIRYYRGRPLGILLAAVRPDHPPSDSTSALLKPTVVGLGTTLSPTETGTLFLKINDSAGELGDNAGELKVQVVRE